jgi:1-acyl-sn-glycerol-3-phosphate acyltransferase
MPEGLFQNPLYWLTHYGLRLALGMRYRMHVTGLEHIPGTGGVVIASNHCSYLDPPVICAASRRRLVHFMARDTLFSTRFAHWYFTRVRVIPIDRTRGDLGALKKAIAMLKDGQVVGLFPEGTRSPDGQLHEAKGGIGFLIAKADVPVVPVHIAGTFEAFPKGASRLRPSRLRVRLGPPISPAEIHAAMPVKGDYAAVGALVMQRIRELADPLGAS